MKDHLLQSKLHRPAAAPDIVPQARLVDLLNEGRERTLTLISAPAGYGKSWLDRLGGLEVAENTSEGVILEGPLPDQAALAGVLDTLFALHLPILEVTCLQEHS